jgi:hypothetical protein
LGRADGKRNEEGGVSMNAIEKFETGHITGTEDKDYNII